MSINKTDIPYSEDIFQISLRMNLILAKALHQCDTYVLLKVSTIATIGSVAL